MAKTLQKRFQSTHPLRGATRLYDAAEEKYMISIHAPLAGCDGAAEKAFERMRISIHAPLAGCDLGAIVHIRAVVNFNPRTPCGVRQVSGDVGFDLWDISIHAPLAGCDAPHQKAAGYRSISIHAPLAGCDLMECYATADILEFQSTHPLRGATWVYGSPNT